LYYAHTLADRFSEAKHTELISGSLKKSYKTFYDKSKPTRGGIKLNLFIPFIEMSIKSLEENGYLGFIARAKNSLSKLD